MNNVLKFPPTDNVSLPQAIRIVKSRLHDDDISIKSRTIAIEKVANMETHNTLCNKDLVYGVAWCKRCVVCNITCAYCYCNKK